MINNVSTSDSLKSVAAACSHVVSVRSDVKQSVAVSSRNPLSDRTNKERINLSTSEEKDATTKIKTVSTKINSKNVYTGRRRGNKVNQNKNDTETINKEEEEQEEEEEEEEEEEVEDDQISLTTVKSSQELIRLYERGNKKLVLQSVEILEQKLAALRTQLSACSSSSPTYSSLISLTSHITSELTLLDTFLSSIPPHDIDSCDKFDAQALVDYLTPIYTYLLEKERHSLLPRHFLSRLQPDITDRMRSILVDWLVEVHRMFKLLPETLFLTVYIIDKYLSLERVERDKLQLIGVTAMLVASKYEEIYAPECNDFVYVSDGAYTKKQILEMEGRILNALSFRLTTPLALQFLRRYSKVASSDYNVHSLCKYIIEIALLDCDIHTYPPSIIAAASVYIARKMTGESSLWNPTMEHYTSYSETEVVEASQFVNTTLKTIKGSTTLKAIEKKYSMVKFGQVTNIPLVDM
eukprot:TRINITY_DN529_c0_g1_i1.p1 TRINITY_DN529_c0_g1~~TRINITY_DN529_c0_g1_i1.p1  ORF type:complete len:466 (+),score=104.83 TRINITY_DN529_c0_g1_i1:1512-2909(+)